MLIKIMYKSFGCPFSKMSQQFHYSFGFWFGKLWSSVQSTKTYLCKFCFIYTGKNFSEFSFWMLLSVLHSTCRQLTQFSFSIVSIMMIPVEIYFQRKMKRSGRLFEVIKSGKSYIGEYSKQKQRKGEKN